MAKYKNQLDIYGSRPLAAPFPKKVTITVTTEGVDIIKSDGSRMTRNRMMKQISYDNTPVPYKRLPGK